ncbi:hypothetical protein EIKCOROL_02578 [Eikenella corrodens ATCC 23834]|uniref:Uncharacterized protein n=1 Tax=Eikenella corrodens ATCC 23834 TaxID=546274 RepID=C0DYW2_EIKCO|nr:hypothetical protein EIKCOROL_02578 [Eikenella corrodens ATCC 23834]
MPFYMDYFVLSCPDTDSNYHELAAITNRITAHIYLLGITKGYLKPQ